MAKRIKRCVRRARSFAADKSLDGETASAKPSKTPMQDEPKPAGKMEHESSTRRNHHHATIHQVSVDVGETLAMLQKLMPGKRLSEKQMEELAAVLTKNHRAFAKDSKDYEKVTDEYSCQHNTVTDDAKP